MLNCQTLDIKKLGVNFAAQKLYISDDTMTKPIFPCVFW